MKRGTPWQRLLLSSGRFFFRVRNALFPMLLLLAIVFVRPARFGGSETLDRVGTAFGLLLVFAGQSLRLMVIGFAYIRRGGRDGQVYATELVTRGFYAHSRNPMYVGNFLIVAGLSLVYGSPWVYGLWVPFFAFVYLAITSAEEAYLGARFGAAYEDYCRRVNRFIPKLKGLLESLSEFRYDWRRALIKEYNTLAVTAAITLGLIIWKTVYLYGFEPHKTLVLVLGWLFLPVGLFYATIRYLKKTRRLRPARWAESEIDVHPSP